VVVDVARDPILFDLQHLTRPELVHTRVDRLGCGDVGVGKILVQRLPVDPVAPGGECAHQRLDAVREGQQSVLLQPIAGDNAGKPVLDQQQAVPRAIVDDEGEMAVEVASAGVAVGGVQTNQRPRIVGAQAVRRRRRAAGDHADRRDDDPAHLAVRDGRRVGLISTRSPSPCTDS
jgi:hypothetical protein